MSFIFYILEKELMNLDDFLILKKSFSHIRKQICNIKKNISFL